MWNWENPKNIYTTKASNPLFFLFFASGITPWIIRQESEDEERNKEYHYGVNKEFESKHYTISK